MKTYSLIFSLLSILLLFSCKKDKSSPPTTHSAFPYTDTFSGASHVTHKYVDDISHVEFNLDTSYTNLLFVTHIDSSKLAFCITFPDYEPDYSSPAGYSAYTYSQSDTFSLAATGIYLDSSRYHQTRYQLVGDSIAVSKYDGTPFIDLDEARNFYFSGER